jgi:hypothetical protein
MDNKHPEHDQGINGRAAAAEEDHMPFDESQPCTVLATGLKTRPGIARETRPSRGAIPTTHP